MKLVIPVCHAQRREKSLASQQAVQEAAEHVPGTLVHGLPHIHSTSHPPVAILGGAEAIVCIARHIWWALPLAWLWLLPPLRPPLRHLYAWIAAHRHCFGGTCTRPEPGRLP